MISLEVPQAFCCIYEEIANAEVLRLCPTQVVYRAKQVECLDSEMMSVITLSAVSETSAGLSLDLCLLLMLVPFSPHSGTVLTVRHSFVGPWFVCLKSVKRNVCKKGEKRRKRRGVKGRGRQGETCWHVCFGSLSPD